MSRQTSPKELNQFFKIFWTDYEIEALFDLSLCRHQNNHNDNSQQNLFKGKAPNAFQMEHLLWVIQVIRCLGFELVGCGLYPGSLLWAHVNPLFIDNTSGNNTFHSTFNYRVCHNTSLYSLYASIANCGSQKSKYCAGITTCPSHPKKQQQRETSMDLGVRPGFQSHLCC